MPSHTLFESGSGAAPHPVKPPSFTAIIAVMVVACLLIAGLDAWRTWAARGTEIADQQAGTANLARSLAQHAHDMLDMADTLLVSLRETIETEGHDPATRPRLQRLMALQIATVPTLRDVMVFDAKADRNANSGRPGGSMPS